MEYFHPKFIIDEKNNKQSVVLPIGEWEEIFDVHKIRLIIPMRSNQKMNRYAKIF